MRFADRPPFPSLQKYGLARPHIANFDVTMLLEPISPALGAHSTGFKLLPASTSSKQFRLRGNFDKQ
jgi:hypothetical protein